MGRLSTHVLDLVRGGPARGVGITLHRIASDGSRSLVKATATNADGRTEEPLLAGDVLQAGTFELCFEVATYFQRTGAATTDPPFLDIVSIRFTVADRDGNYHVPLLVSPWSYSTYRGS